MEQSSATKLKQELDEEKSSRQELESQLKSVQVFSQFLIKQSIVHIIEPSLVVVCVAA